MHLDDRTRAFFAQSHHVIRNVERSKAHIFCNGHRAIEGLEINDEQIRIRNRPIGEAAVQLFGKSHSFERHNGNVLRVTPRHEALGEVRHTFTIGKRGLRRDRNPHHARRLFQHPATFYGRSFRAGSPRRLKPAITDSSPGSAAVARFARRKASPRVIPGSSKSG